MRDDPDNEAQEESLCLDAFRNEYEHGDGPVEVLDGADRVVRDEADDDRCPGAPQIDWEVERELGGQDEPGDSPGRRRIRSKVDAEPERREVVSVVAADEVVEVGLAGEVRLLQPEEEERQGGEDGAEPNGSGLEEEQKRQDQK
jgi:hypothetical protein